MRSGIRGMGFAGGMCLAPNVTSRQFGMAGMGQFDWGSIDWTSIGQGLIGLGSQAIQNQAPQQQQQPTVIYQQAPAQQQPAAGASSNTGLYVAVGVGVLAVGGLVWWAMSQKKGR